MVTQVKHTFLFSPIHESTSGQNSLVTHDIVLRHLDDAGFYDFLDMIWEPNWERCPETMNDKQWKEFQQQCRNLAESIDRVRRVCGDRSEKGMSVEVSEGLYSAALLAFKLSRDLSLSNRDGRTLAHPRKNAMREFLNGVVRGLCQLLPVKLDALVVTDHGALSMYSVIFSGAIIPDLCLSSAKPSTETPSTDSLTKDFAKLQTLEDDPQSSILHEMTRSFNETGLADNFFRLMDESGRSLFTEGSDGSPADTEGSVLEMLNEVAHRLLQRESQHEEYLAAIVHQLVDELDKQGMYGNNQID